MLKQIIYFLLLIFILSDISYSFVQHLHQHLDGDMAKAILPSPDYQKIQNDPFAIKVLTQNATYPDPNRFFAHYTFSKYFQYIPFIFQHFVSPIQSVYLSCAFAKTIIQIALLILLGFYITGKRNIFKLEFLIAIALITPLFQTNGYVGYMGIIDSSITYTFFYALPCAFLLLFYLPFFNSSFYEKKFSTNKLIIILLILFTVFLTLNGPLIPGVVLIVSLLYILFHFKNNYNTTSETVFISKIKTAINKIPKPHFFFFIFISLLSLYSLYIGKNNSQFINDQIPIAQRYSRLPAGLYFLLTQKIGVPLLISMIGVNAILIKRNYKNSEGNKILNFLKWIAIFSLFYILLLPMGGYRAYRPNIIRYDSVMPITIALFFIYGISSLFLINNFRNNSRKMYLFFTLLFSFVFTFSDEPELDKNKCEKQALETLSNSKQNTVLLNNDCNIMAWEKITDPKESTYNAQLFQYWGITKEKKLYYQNN